MTPTAHEEAVKISRALDVNCCSRLGTSFITIALTSKSHLFLT